VTAQTRDHTIGNKDVNEVLPFDLEAVTTALIPAPAAMACYVTVQLPGRIEGERNRGHSTRTGIGGEKVIATLAAQDPRTSVGIQTIRALLRMKNWSMPIYNELKKNLQPALAPQKPLFPYQTMMVRSNLLRRKEPRGRLMYA
jgi:hypothetical protein